MIKSTHYRTPRTLSECRWDPRMAPIEKSYRRHVNQRLDRWIMLGALGLMVVCLLAVFK